MGGATAPSFGLAATGRIQAIETGQHGQAGAAGALPGVDLRSGRQVCRAEVKCLYLSLSKIWGIEAALSKDLGDRSGVI